MTQRYLRQIAVITPYTEFSFYYKAEDEKNNMRLVFRWAGFLVPLTSLGVRTPT